MSISQSNPIQYRFNDKAKEKEEKENENAKKKLKKKIKVNRNRDYYYFGERTTIQFYLFCLALCGLSYFWVTLSPFYILSFSLFYSGFFRSFYDVF